MADQHEKNDHDLLIRLDERVASFEQNVSRMLLDFSTKIAQLLDHLEKKADKSEVQAAVFKVEGHETRLQIIETNLKIKDETNKTKNQLIEAIGSAGWKFWLALIGVGTVIIGILKTK